MHEPKPFEYNLSTLDSGLRLVTVPMEGTRTVTVLVLVGTGSKYETKNINGISHFLEHMMFKGTTKRPGNLDISRELDSIGAEYNAFTAKEYTGYYAKASADKLDTAMDVIADIFINSKMDERDIAVEKGVIVEEINMYRDNPAHYIGNLFEHLLYGDQPAGWDIAGEKEIVMNLKRSDFVDYFTTHYIAQNTVVVVAGNVKPEDVKEKAMRHFKDIRQGLPATKLPVKEEQDEPQTLVHWKETDQAHFILGLRSYNMYDEKKYPAALLSMVLGGGMSSRLFQEVRVKRGLAYYIGADNDTSTDTGVFSVNAGVDKTRVAEAVKVVVEELRKVKLEGITEQELQQAKDHFKGSFAISLEHTDHVAASFANPLLFENKILTPEEKLARIQKVTLEEVNKVAQEIFENSKLNLALIGPFKDEAPFKEILKI